LNGTDQDPRRIVLSRLIRLWVIIAAVLLSIAITCDWLTPQVSRAWPEWVATLWVYAIRYAIGFATGFALLGGITAYQKSQLK